MDYCHPCRRHLNGALACPGCGAPVEQPGGYPQRFEPGPDGAQETFRQEGAGAPDAPAGAEPGAETDDGPRVPGRAARRREQGRGGRSRGRGPSASADERIPGPSGADASRRDRKAAAHRRRRRRIVLITTGFVLAAGGLSLAELGIDAPGFSSSPNPAAAGGESSEVDGGTAKPSASAQPLDDRTDPDEGEGGASASPDASPSASESAEDEDHASQSPDRGAQSATVPASSAPSTPTDSDSTPAADPTTSAPSPESSPSPSETCTRFLWWCS
ncbi:hypothetical protein [Streptomyces sp. NPDC002588]|uniref:SCO2400 family protein n=1 Tax=Streptomyces sp. NPDC002588 TaxID=3154419 RepID=UPI00331BFD67